MNITSYDLNKKTRKSWNISPIEKIKKSKKKYNRKQNKNQLKHILKEDLS